MNARNFHEYIDNPSQLYQISYQELKSLVLQYPYCQSLRYLLLQKSKMENHKDFQRNLEMASTYSVDREFLFQLMKELETQPEAEESYMMEEEVLELKDLTRLEDNTELIEIEQKEIEELKQFSFQHDSPKEETPSVEGGFTEIEESDDFLENLLNEEDSLLANAASDEPFITNLDELSHTIDEIAPPIEGDLAPLDSEVPNEPINSIEEVIEVMTKAKIVDDELVSNLASFSEVVEYLNEDIGNEDSDNEDIPLEITNKEILVEDAEVDDTIPQPKSSFNSWVQQFESPLLEKRLDELAEISRKAKEKRKEQGITKKEIKVEKRPKDKPKKKATQLAKESIQEDDDIASETLAMILESQGHIDRAIDMYERLSLQNPEKSSSFAAKIEELKSQL